MVEHWGQERCKKTSEKLERQQANKFEVKMAEFTHDEAFKFGDVCSMFAVIDLNMLEYHLSIITACILLDLFNLECNFASSSQPEGNNGVNLQPEYSNASHLRIAKTVKRA